MSGVLRAGLIGTGSIAKYHLEAITGLDSIKVTAIAGHHIERAGSWLMHTTRSRSFRITGKC